jgi:prephenate dehydratase
MPSGSTASGSEDFLSHRAWLAPVRELYRLRNFFTASQGKGRIACVPQNNKKFIDAAKKLRFATTQETAFHISGPDKVGALCNVLDVLDKESININVLDAISFSGRFGSYVWVDSKDVKVAAKALKV